MRSGQYSICFIVLGKTFVICLDADALMKILILFLFWFKKKCFLKNVQKLSLLTDRRLYFCVEITNWFVFSISVDVHIPANVFATIMWSKNAL